jgi:hypothetical protein
LPNQRFQLLYHLLVRDDIMGIASVAFERFINSRLHLICYDNLWNDNCEITGQARDEFSTGLGREPGGQGFNLFDGWDFDCCHNWFSFLNTPSFYHAGSALPKGHNVNHATVTRQPQARSKVRGVAWVTSDTPGW